MPERDWVDHPAACTCKDCDNQRLAGLGRSPRESPMYICQQCNGLGTFIRGHDGQRIMCTTCHGEGRTYTKPQPKETVRTHDSDCQCHSCRILASLPDSASEPDPIPEARRESVTPTTVSLSTPTPRSTRSVPIGTPNKPDAEPIVTQSNKAEPKTIWELETSKRISRAKRLVLMRRIRKFTNLLIVTIAVLVVVAFVAFLFFPARVAELPGGDSGVVSEVSTRIQDLKNLVQDLFSDNS